MPRVPITMPKMSMTMEFGTVVEWLLAPGDAIRSGEAIAVVTTDKVDMDVEATANGTLSEILAQPGEQVPVGQPMGWMESETDDLLGDLFAAPAPAAVAEPAAESVPPTPAETSGTTPRAVPLARRLAREAGLDLADVTPSGPTGTIRARDVRAALAALKTAGPPAPKPEAQRPAPAPAARATSAALSGSDAELLGDAKSRRMRVATARALEQTAAIPQFTAWRTLDLTRLSQARKASLRGVSWNTLLLRAYALTLREYPQLNGTWTGAGVQPNADVRVALAIDTPSGLLAPVVAGVLERSVAQLDSDIRALVGQIRGGQIDPDSLAGATGTLSNLGSLGVDRFNALLTPPQATALSLGAVTTRPVFADDGGLKSQVCCEAGLTVDHRAADGADAARALATLQEFLDDPLSLIA